MRQPRDPCLARWVPVARTKLQGPILERPRALKRLGHLWRCPTLAGVLGPVPRRSEATGKPRDPQRRGVVLQSLRAVVLEEISLQRSTASDPNSTVDQRRAAGERSVLSALLRRGLGGGRRSDVGEVSDGRVLSDGRGLITTGTFRLTQLGVAWSPVRVRRRRKIKLWSCWRAVATRFDSIRDSM